MSHEAADAPVVKENVSESSRQLPGYAEEMADFHEAFTPELEALLDQLPLEPAMRVIDVGSGDGFYAGLFAGHVCSPSCVVGLDINRAFLSLARKQSAGAHQTCEVAFVEGKLDELPLHGEEFDLAWCAQSLYSLREPDAALRQMRRLVRPGGLVAVLENDTMHQLMLPWPASLEIALRAAEYQTLARTSSCPEKYYVGRRLWEALAESGLEPVGYHVQCINRASPLKPALERFLRAWLVRLVKRVSPEIAGAAGRKFAELTDPQSDAFILHGPHLTLSWLNVLAWGRRPGRTVAMRGE